MPDDFESASAVTEPGLRERTQRSPQSRLLWAVLQDGIKTYMKYAASTDKRSIRVYNEARDWIMQDDPTWVCSFVNICHILDLHPEYIRDGLERWRSKGDPTSLEQAA